MAIPDYETLMLPLLRAATDGHEHRTRDVMDLLAREFNLTEEERQHLLPSGRQPTFDNRVHWARTYLAQAGLIEPTRRGHFRITQRGREALAGAPPRIDNSFLKQFEEFRQFQSRSRQEEGAVSADAGRSVPPPTVQPPQASNGGAQTPDELLRSTVRQIELSLRKELLQRIHAAPAAFFESVIVQLLLAMGYGGSRQDAGQIVGGSGDGGIDGVIDQDPLGLDRVYIQAKRYAPDNAVSEPEIRAFSGSLGAAKANKGVFVTTSSFTRPAETFAERHPFKMVLIDGEQLAALMIRHNVGVRVDETLFLKKIDEDFFVDE